MNSDLARQNKVFVEWSTWWSGLSFARKTLPFVLLTAYLAILIFLNGLRDDLVISSVVPTLLYYGGPRTRCPVRAGVTESGRKIKIGSPVGMAFPDPRNLFAFFSVICLAFSLLVIMYFLPNMWTMMGAKSPFPALGLLKM